MDGFILCVGEFGCAERWKDGNRMMVPLRRVAVDDGVQQAVGIAVAAVAETAHRCVMGRARSCRLVVVTDMFDSVKGMQMIPHHPRVTHHRAAVAQCQEYEKEKMAQFHPSLSVK